MTASLVAEVMVTWQDFKKIVEPGLKTGASAAALRITR